MADADVLPYDYVTYAHDIESYIAAAQRKSLGHGLSSVDFAAAEAAAGRFVAAAQKAHNLQDSRRRRPGELNLALRQTETDLVIRHRPAQSSLVPAHHLRSGRVHRLRGRGDSRRQ